MQVEQGSIIKVDLLGKSVSGVTQFGEPVVDGNLPNGVVPNPAFGMKGKGPQFIRLTETGPVGTNGPVR